MGFSFTTKGGSSPKGKPHLYFACHPADYDACFERVCRDLFACQDCVIHYRAHREQAVDADELDLTLDGCQLLVVPVTGRLLTQDSEALREDIRLARQKGMPVLPLMMDKQLDDLYRNTDVFGATQYLMPGDEDDTALAYLDKLGRYLEDVLVDGTLAARIEQAFKGRIFLSYRKKDRYYANALIRLIHAEDDLRAVAVWYDEFLVPGDTYTDGITQAMKNSDLYLLMVTPHLLEDPNYVKDVEYPAAKEMGLPILAAEMVATDAAAVEQHYPGVFRSLNPALPEERQLLLDCIRVVFGERPMGGSEQEVKERYYLLGRAYFGGVRTETDREMGRAYVEVAALHHHVEAMAWMYHDCRRDGDYAEALIWAQRLAEHYVADTQDVEAQVIWLCEVGWMQYYLAAYEDGRETAEQAWERIPEDWHAAHPSVLAVQQLLGNLYRALGHLSLAREFFRHVVDVRMDTLGATHPDTLDSIQDLASVLDEEDGDALIIEAHQTVYDVKCHVHGAQHPAAMEALVQLGVAYSRAGRYEEALDCLERAYAQYRQDMDAHHPTVLTVAGRIVEALVGLGAYEDACAWGKDVCDACRAVFGAQHPNTLAAMSQYADAACAIGAYDEAYAIFLQVYEINEDRLGAQHPDTIVCLGNLALTCLDMGRRQEGIDRLREIVARCSAVYGEDHPVTLRYVQLLHEAED